MKAVAVGKRCYGYNSTRSEAATLLLQPKRGDPWINGSYMAYVGVEVTLVISIPAPVVVWTFTGCAAFCSTDGAAVEAAAAFVTT